MSWANSIPPLTWRAPGEELGAVPSHRVLIAGPLSDAAAFGGAGEMLRRARGAAARLFDEFSDS